MLAETQITNLLYRYAECIDAGDLAGAAALFEHARIRIEGEPAAPLARAAAGRRGYDISDHRSRNLTNDDLERFALPLGMDRSHLAAMRWMAPRSVADRPQLLLKFAPQTGVLEVGDPFGGPPRGYEDALDLIEFGCKGVLEALRPLAEKAS